MGNSARPYPWPPEKEYWMYRDEPKFPEELVEKFVSDFKEINERFEHSLECWDKYPLWESNVPDFEESFGQKPPFVSVCVQKNHTDAPLIVVFPGGGFLWKADYEGIDVAKHFYDLGFHAAVLNYRTMPYPFDVSCKDASRAVCWLRANAENLGINPHRIAVMGFSAQCMEFRLNFICSLMDLVGYHWEMARDPFRKRPIHMLLDGQSFVMSGLSVRDF